MGVYFTSDNHFGHENIIKYCDRPFSSADEMDKVMIERWNDAIGPSDTIYHLGDFTLNGYVFACQIFARLNGIIKLLGTPWHHDKRWLNAEGASTPCNKLGSEIYILPPMHFIPECYPWDIGPGPDTRETMVNLLLSHYPLAIWERKHYGAVHLHGHSHGRYKGEGRILDVGVDSWGFAPVSLEQVCETMDEILVGEPV